MRVNFNSVTDKQLQALVDYRFAFLSISIDGASQESYAQYRIGGDFDQVISNINRLQEIKRAKGQERPWLQWQYVINEYNELEVGKAKTPGARTRHPDSLQAQLHALLPAKKPGLSSAGDGLGLPDKEGVARKAP